MKYVHICDNEFGLGGERGIRKNKLIFKIVDGEIRNDKFLGYIFSKVGGCLGRKKN